MRGGNMELKMIEELYKQAPKLRTLMLLNHILLYLLNMTDQTPK